MKLKKYFKKLKKLIEDNPDLLDAEVVYSADDEGNAFHTVRNTPTPGVFKNGDFNEVATKNINAICIN